MRMTAISVRDFKRIKEVDLAHLPDAGLVVIGGNNSQGKTSLMGAIEWAFGGSRHRPADPIHRGAERAEVVVRVEDGAVPLTIRRRITAAGKETVVIETDDGKRQHGPQRWLAEVIGERFIDPLAFLTAKPADQRAMLLRCLGLGDELDRLDAERKDAYQTRTIRGRDLRQAEAELAAVGPVRPDVPETVDVSELQRRREELGREELRQDRIRAQRDDAERAETAAAERVDRLKRELAAAEADLATATASRADLAAAVAGFAAVDTFALDDQIETAGARNRAHTEAAALARQWDSANTRLGQLNEELGGLTKRIEEIDAAKTEALASAELPVPGLSVTEDGVTYLGVPFSQAGGAERLRVSLAVAVALRPQLRAIWLTGGESLDAESMAAVEQFAEERDMLVLLERVGTHDVGAVIIEDGGIRGND